jgi:hypothetical protein
MKDEVEYRREIWWMEEFSITVPPAIVLATYQAMSKTDDYETMASSFKPKAAQ